MYHFHQKLMKWNAEKFNFVEEQSEFDAEKVNLMLKIV